MLHRFKCAISNAGHDMLSGHVEVDETVFGGVRHGKRGRGTEGKVLVAIAVELLSPKGFGHCRLQIIPNADAETLKMFIQNHIKPGSIIYTDGLPSCPGAAKDEYIHHGTSIKGYGKDANEVLPGVHRVAAFVKRWLMGTHQGSFEEGHLHCAPRPIPELQEDILPVRIRMLRTLAHVTKKITEMVFSDQA